MEKSLLYIIPSPPAIPPLRIKVSGEEMVRTVLGKCEALGWLWSSGRLPTSFIPDANILFFDQRITFSFMGDGEAGQGSDYLFFDFTKPLFPSDKKDGDLKSYNTQPGRITCYSCGGLLKNPMGTPQFQYCPKCEP